MEIRNAYTKQKRNAFKTTGESLTQQHHAEQVKVQNVIKRYDKTGILDHVARGVAMYGDYSKINEYKTNLEFVMAANESFAGLPSNIREKFSNDPGEFFEFATDPKNKDEMVKMGLFPAPNNSPKDGPMPSEASPQPSETKPSKNDSTE
jgi:phage internal scaffolding protein